ncbi:hypothetical protein AgCh_011488 [Apium graveolens]
MEGRGLLYTTSAAAAGGGSSSNNTNALLHHHMPFPFLDSRSMVSFKDVSGRMHSERSFFRSFGQDGNEDEDFDEYFHQPEKKRRLKADQIEFLEKSFEADNKLEPERKVQLAKDIGLQPRQVAIWFQNRRARWKNKSLERDYEVLQDSYNSLKVQYDNLVKEKDKLKVQVLDLTDKLCLKEKEKDGLEVVNTQALSAASQQEHIENEVSKGEVSNEPILTCKQDDNPLVKSDPLYSDSPNYIDVVNSSLLEAGNPVQFFDIDQSDMSQDEEENIRRLLLPSLAYMFPRIGDISSPDLPASTCSSGFPIEEEAYDFWAY